MTSDSADLTPPDASGDRPLLIEPAARRRFVTLYVVVTLVASLVVRYLWSYIFQFLPLGRASYTLVMSLLAGATVGFGQWWVLRRYVPTWLWIAAATLGQFAVAVGDVLWLNHVLAQAQQNPYNFMDAFAGNYAMPFHLTVLATLPMIILQWLVLRRYLKAAYAWFLVPLVVTLVTTGVFIFTGLLGLIPSLPIRVALPVLVPGVGGTVQAIAFCLFHSKRGVPLSELEAASQTDHQGNADRDIKSLIILACVTLLGVVGVAMLIGSLGVIIERIQL